MSFTSWILLFSGLALFSDNLTSCGSRYINQQFQAYILQTLQPFSQTLEKVEGLALPELAGSHTHLDPIILALWIVYTD